MSTTDNAGGTPEAGAKAGETQATAQGQQTTTEQKGETPKSFDEWLSAQDHSTQELIEQHTTGLRGSLQSERDARKKLEKDLKALAKGAEQGSDLHKKLEEMGTNLRDQNARADFYEEAHKKGVSNLKLAYYTAKIDGLLDEKGRVDWDDLKKEHPELFAAAHKAATPPGNPGNGTREGPPKQVLSGNAAVNAAIRHAAGRY